ncbi:hypothetical protein [Streptomyces sp. NPDC127033]|uniref:hypothetical protein n=1 Tax=Streptomyces sp. NPDC127033 TaxID=3347110 RepID=UPI00364A777E
MKDDAAHLSATGRRGHVQGSDDQFGIVTCPHRGAQQTPGEEVGRVSPRRLRTFRATRPSSAMIFAMVFTETRQPCLTSLIARS